MKFLATCIVMICFCLQLSAQDTLIKRNGDTLIIKLTEMGIDDIRYKRLDYQEGPVFVIAKAEVKQVIFPNGKRESFDNYQPTVKMRNPNEDLTLSISGKFFYYKERRITEPDMLSIVYKLNDKGLNLMGKKIERMRFGQNMGVICAATFFIYGLYSFQSGQVRGGRGRRGVPPQLTSANLQAQNRGKVLMLAGLVSGAISVSFMLDRRKHDRLIVDAYNKRILK